MDRSEYLLFAVTETLFDGDLEQAIKEFYSLEQYKEWIQINLNHEEYTHDFDLANKAKDCYGEYLYDKEMSEDTEAFYSYINSQDEV